MRIVFLPPDQPVKVGITRNRRRRKFWSYIPWWTWVLLAGLFVVTVLIITQKGG